MRTLVAPLEKLRNKLFEKLVKKSKRWRGLLSKYYSTLFESKAKSDKYKTQWEQNTNMQIFTDQL